MNQSDNKSLIFEILVMSSESRIVFEVCDAAITDIAVNWINGDIYYIDSVTSSINVWDVSTNSTKEIINSLKNPRKMIYSSVMRYEHTIRILWWDVLATYHA